MGGIQASIKRLHPRHEAIPILTAKASSLEAGISGEIKLAETLRKHSFPFEHRVFHDLSLVSSALFQIDTLFLTRFYAVVFEVKNIGGRLEFKDDPPQLVRRRETGEVDGFESPAAQVERNGDLLELWLKGHGIQIPVYRIVVLAYPKQIIDKAPAKTQVLFPNYVPPFIHALPRKQAILDSKTFRWLTAKLLNSHINYIPRPVCDIYNIPPRDIQTGVICSHCDAIGMVKIKRSWRCRSCGSLDHKAHERGVREWFLIMGREMTNKDCREFLRVDMNTASRILCSMDLNSIGSCRYRKYTINFHKKDNKRADGLL
ncbi:nuclease-related domain-containing protein [Siminovitchia fortis]|uniref:nuclease-related domain-containing protein n=1 Tax=Siminovitchia fortis TaxID=254758 RepID=UPI0021BD612D|nr:nuclease-related domain-containing protein [Siminovitchia fortis]